MFDCLSDLELHFSNLARWYLTPRQWVFAQFTQVDPKLEMMIIFLFLRYWGSRCFWDMHNVFVFDGRHGVKAYLQKQVEISFLNEMVVLPIASSTCSTTHVVSG